MAFTQQEYETLIERFNKLPFAEQLDRIKANPEVLQLHMHVECKNMPPEIKEKLTDFFKLNL